MIHKITGTKDEITEAIDNSIIGFKSIRNREILKDHFVDGLTFEEVAEKHDMSVRHVKKISYDNEPIVTSYLSKNR